jgi:hypothetical protein
MTGRAHGHTTAAAPSTGAPAKEDDQYKPSVPTSSVPLTRSGAC